MSDALTDFERRDFTWRGARREVLVQGAGPAVVVMHEIPGFTPTVAAFARRVADAGYTAWCPLLFGVPGRPPRPQDYLSEIGRACISREFAVLAARRSSPITEWLRALCRHAHAACGGPGVGAVGMCLTGNFALALMVDEVVMAPVLSQPSLPFALTPGLGRGLHLSPGDLETVRRRSAAGCTVLGLRFTHDWMCPPARFQALREALGDGFEGIEIDSGPGNPHGIPRLAHSVLTEDLVDVEGRPTRQALDRVLALFAERLGPSTG